MSEHEVVIVRYGTRESTRSQLYLNYGLYGEQDAPMRIDYFVWLVRSPTSTILIDTGFSRAGGEARDRTMLIDPVDALVLLGVEPDDVDTVVLTHAHYDHVGNLGSFPSSRIVMARAEYEFWTSDIAKNAQFSYFSDARELNVIETANDDGRLDLIDDTREIAEGVLVEVVGGHTPGQSIVIVRTPRGVVVLASDAAHFYEEIERGWPFSATAEVPATFAAFDLIRERVAADSAILLTGHDASTLDRFPRVGGAIGEYASVIG